MNIALFLIKITYNYFPLCQPKLACIKLGLVQLLLLIMLKAAKNVY